MGILDVIGVASIIPFIAVLANPDLVESNSILSMLYTRFNFTNIQNFLILLGIMFFVILVSSLAFKAWTVYVQIYFVQMSEYNISKRLVEAYLHQPYTWFLNRNSTKIGKTVLDEVSAATIGAMMPLMNLISQGIVVILILALLIIVHPKLALIIGIVLSVVYMLLYRGVRGYLFRIGETSRVLNQQRFSTVMEVFSAVKEVKVGGLENIYVRRFRLAAKGFAKNRASVGVITQMPHFALQGLIFGGMLLVVLYLMNENRELNTILPVITVYAFAGYRLMPAIHTIYTNLALIRFSNPVLDALYEDITNLTYIKPNQVDSQIIPIKISRTIELSNIYFTYPKAQQASLKGINLNISARHTIGLVGATGSGKTTTVDLILGLLRPEHGSVKVDGISINKANLRQWQRATGYVPQQIYLSDDTIAANIAFGLEVNEIDKLAVERAARIANLHEFVISELDKGYETAIGERGIRLSGGQRQRIGIARALYHNPQLLILDEATSALDNLTERAVMDAIHNLEGEITIIIIAHRLTTVRKCDQIYFLSDGRVKDQGTYEELVEKNDIFRSMTADVDTTSDK